MKISVKVDDDGLLRALQKAGPEAEKRAKKKLRTVSLAVENRVKQDMPVDTGRARAGWGHWTPGDVVKKDKQDGGPLDGVWQVKNGGLTIEQGTNIPYVARLEEGSSLQAPAGFIESAARLGMRELVKELAKIVDIFR